MTEDFLQYIWKFSLFEKRGLRTVEGESIQIIRQGNLNSDSGPDFRDAIIRIGNETWAGNVELHICSSDWMKHRHQKDAAYNNVILHVVFQNDREVNGNGGRYLPTLVLKGRFDESLYWKYERLLHNFTTIPCASMMKGVPDITKRAMLDRVLIERLQSRSASINALLKANKGDWNETFYQWLARGFGLRVNAEPMLLLAKNLPLKILMWHANDLFQLEALLFGVSGLLSGERGSYAVSLGKEFNFLKKKYGLYELQKEIWKFARMRPPAFPTLRLAQFAALIKRKKRLLSELVFRENGSDWNDLSTLTPSEYWHTHYRFSVLSKMKKNTPGESFRSQLLINVVVPFLFVFGPLRGQFSYREKALDILTEMPSEDNKITRELSEIGLESLSAGDSQAMLQLKLNYCDLKKCLNCGIGNHILQKE